MKKKKYSSVNISGCYGKLYSHHERCKTCTYRKWCRTAWDETTPDKEKRAEHTVELTREMIVREVNPATPVPEFDFDAPVYSQKELMEVIVFMLVLDNQTLDLLEEKINNPEITFSQMAKKRNLTRQAVHKFIDRKCRKIPELKEVFIKRTNAKSRPAAAKKLKRKKSPAKSGVNKSNTAGLSLVKASEISEKSA